MDDLLRLFLARQRDVDLRLAFERLQTCVVGLNHHFSPIQIVVRRQLDSPEPGGIVAVSGRFSLEMGDHLLGRQGTAIDPHLVHHPPELGQIGSPLGARGHAAKRLVGFDL